MGYSPWGHKELDTTEGLTHTQLSSSVFKVSIQDSKPMNSCSVCPMAAAGPSVSPRSRTCPRISHQTDGGGSHT